MNSDTITLISCDAKLLGLILKGDVFLSEELNISIPDRWCESVQDILEVILEKVTNNPNNSKWFIHLPINKERQTLIGSCGFKGPPNKEGLVEIGYEVAANFRNQGYGTAIANNLINLALKDKRVKEIIAHTLAEKNASVRVLEKCKFKFVKEYYKKEEGRIWKWSYER